MPQASETPLWVGDTVDASQLSVPESPLVTNAREVRAALHEATRVLRADWLHHYGEELERPATRVQREWGSVRGEPRTRPELDAEASIAHGLARVRELSEQWEQLLADPEAARALAAASTARAWALRRAIALVRTVDGAGNEDRVDALVRHAARRSRSLTRAEQETIAASDGCTSAGGASIGYAPQATQASQAAQPTPEPDAVLDAVLQIRIRQARRELEAGLVLNPQMRELIAAATPAVLTGAPILLIGETGGAKTALAEHLAGLGGTTHEFVSGYGDITGAQIIGAHELRASGDATVTEFAPGPLLRAMQRGVPIILDEINAMPPEFLKRLNRILQLRPGARFAVQEQPGLTVEIASGFVVLATANEYAPHRYRGIEPLSAELVNRFGSGTFRVHYPDSGADISDVPAENLLLAAAVVSAPDGSLPQGLGIAELTPLARAAFISQQVFVGNPDAALERYRGTEREFDDEPGLAETVIAPRTLAAVLQGVMLQGGATALTGALERFTAGVMHAADRAVLRLILVGQGLLT
ncbi:AAA family ATPase [Leucobacter komagatae]|uniref:AAA family ATPase n=1 Tax=Leucobacter komagatae TaxID=55969 RepID=UPI0031D32DB3